MPDNTDTLLDILKQAVLPMMAEHPEVVVGTSRSSDGTKECLVLTVESARPCRYLRVHSTDEPGPDDTYAWLWSSYWARYQCDNSDGRKLGGLQRTLDAIRHWIIQGMRWQDVPEFASYS